MENASKALIIAGGVLLAILILSLIVYARTSISEYQNSKTELENIEKIAKFNEQFSQYDRNDVAGYELISLANFVDDYNFRYSKDGINNNGYNPIKMIVKFKNSDDRKKLTYDDTIRLFTSNRYEQSTTKKEIKSIIEEALMCETDYGTEECISRISKNINSIFIKEWNSNPDEAFKQKKEALRLFHEIVPKDIRKNNLKLMYYNIYKDEDEEKKIIRNDLVEDAYNELKNSNRAPNRTIIVDVYKYYEYTQFKRCIFKCNEMSYNNKTGRIEKLTYEFVKIR